MKDCFSASSAALRKLLSAQDAPRRKVSDKKQQSTLLAVILGRTKNRRGGRHVKRAHRSMCVPPRPALMRQDLMAAASMVADGLAKLCAHSSTSALAQTTPDRAARAHTRLHHRDATRDRRAPALFERTPSLWCKHPSRHRARSSASRRPCRERPGVAPAPWGERRCVCTGGVRPCPGLRREGSEGPDGSCVRCAADAACVTF